MTTTLCNQMLVGSELNLKGLVVKVGEDLLKAKR